MAGVPNEGHIFISYRRQEPDKSFTLKLADDLKAAGHPIWMDIEGIEGAETWTDEIQRAIESCYAYVVILSPSSMASRWVRNELLYALGQKPGVVYPIVFREVPLPVELVAVQFVDFQDDYAGGLARLLRDLPQPPRTGPRFSDDIEMALKSETGAVRWGAVAALIDFAHGDANEQAALARQHLEEMAQNDPDERVRGTAQSFFDEEEALRLAEEDIARQADVDAKLAEARRLQEEAEAERERLEAATREREEALERARKAREITPAPAVAPPPPPPIVEDIHPSEELEPGPAAPSAKRIWFSVGLTAIGRAIWEGGILLGLVVLAFSETGIYVGDLASIGFGVGPSDLPLRYVNVGWIIGAIVGLGVGLITGLALRLVVPSLKWKQVGLITLGWAFGWDFGFVVVAPAMPEGTYLINFTTAITLLAIIGAIGGLITGVVLRRAVPSLSWIHVGLITLGWVLANAFGFLLFNGLIGGGIMYWTLNRALRDTQTQ